MRQEGRTAAAFVCRYIHRLCFHDQMSFGGGRCDVESGGHHKNCLFDLHYAHTCHGTNTMSYRARSIGGINVRYPIASTSVANQICHGFFGISSLRWLPFTLPLFSGRFGSERGLSFPLFCSSTPLFFSLQRSVGRAVRSPMHKLKANS